MTLTHQEAKQRFKKISSKKIHYDFYFNLSKGSAYHGLARIVFDVSETSGLFLDFNGKSLDKIIFNQSVEINSQAQLSGLYKDGRVTLPEDHLKMGENELLVYFRNEYNKDGNGLHSFIDTDGLQYVYTQSEPYWHNRIVPVFDQPDLFGVAKYFFLHPTDWVIVSNSSTERTYEVLAEFANNNKEKGLFESLILKHYRDDFDSPDKSFTVFARTVPICTYLFCFVAGPFSKIALPAEKEYKSIPMSIFCRKSKSKYIEAQQGFFFEVLTKGIAFFEGFFKHSFPYEKWDFVFCPEYTIGAMEHPGCVTFNDTRYIHDSPVIPVSVRTSLTNVILHELSHMWFGNLVSIKWWDGTWLKEAFAEFCSLLACAKLEASFSFELEDIKVMKFGRKFRGYKEDSNLTTHSIVCEVVDTHQASSVFDGITYFKGYSVFMQLYHVIGHEVFSKCISSYIQEFRWCSTSLQDLIKHFRTGCKSIDIVDWMEKWLHTSGTNLLSCEWDPSQPGEQTLVLKQGSVLKDHHFLRPHKLNLAFFQQNGGIAEIRSIYMPAEEKLELPFKNKGIKGILVNYDDLDFVLASFDEHSTSFFLENLEKLECKLSILLILHSMSFMVNEGRVKVGRLVRACAKVIYRNSDDSSFLNLVRLILLPLIRKLPSKCRGEYEEEIFGSLCAHLEANPGVNIQAKMVLVSILNHVGTSKRSATRLFCVLLKLDPLEGVISFGEQTKFSIIYKVLGNYQGDEKIWGQALKTFQQSAESETKRNYHIQINAMMADQAERKRLWEEVFCDSNRNMSFVQLKFAAVGFTSSYVSLQVRREYLPRYFEELPKVLQNEDKEIGIVWIQHLLPVVEDLESVIAEYSKLINMPFIQTHKYFLKRLKMRCDDLQKMSLAWKFMVSQEGVLI